MGALISICNMCFAAEDVELVQLSGMKITDSGHVDSSSSYVYTFENNISTGRTIGFSNEIVSVGYQFDSFNFVNGNGSYTFNGGSIGYVYFNCSISNLQYIKVTRQPLVGMTGFVDNLAYDLSYANLSGVIFFVVPIMSIAILFGLGFYLLKRLLNRIKRAKGGV